MRPDSFSSRVEEVGNHFEQFHKNGSGYKAVCPAHNDNTPSLSIREGKGGRILLKCFAGCGTENVLGAAGLTMKDLQPPGDVYYDYTDKNGQLLYQVVRKRSKEFLQRRPDGKGWQWNTNDTRKVLYKLPELMNKTDLQKRIGKVYVTVGEKDADNLRSLGLTATTNAGGANAKWMDEYTETLRGRNVVLLPDNDEAGLRRVRRIAEALLGVARSVRIVKLPNLNQKGDVTDWLSAGGAKEKLKELVRDQAPLPPGYYPPFRAGNRSAFSGNEHDFDAKNGETGCGGPVLSFPVASLPKCLQRYVRSVANALPVPPDFPGVMILPVLATLIGRKRRIEVKPGWTEYPLLWTAVIARSGDRKSPAYQQINRPLKSLQQQLVDQFRKELEEYNDLDPEKQAEAEVPQLRQAYTTDTTIEAFKEVLEANPNGICYLADELSGWVRSMSQYKGGRGNDRQIWLSLWSSDDIVTNRKGKVPCVVTDPFACVSGGIQPDALKDIVGDGREDGLSARFLFAFPDELENQDWTDDEIEGTSAYEDVCNHLWKLNYRDEPHRFLPKAKDRWIAFVNEHRKERTPDILKPTWSKLEGYCARLALVLHITRQVCGETTNKEVDEASVNGAIELVEYFKSHAQRVYKSAPPSKTRAELALKWLARNGGEATARKFKENGVARCKSSAEAKELFKQLEAAGHGTVEEGKKKSVTFRLNATNAPPAPRINKKRTDPRENTRSKRGVARPKPGAGDQRNA